MPAVLLMLTFFLAQTAAPASSPASPGGGFGFFVPFIFIFVIMYFIMIRPQQRRQKEQQKLIGALKTGDRIVTSSGIHGRITNVKETTVIVSLTDNVKIEMDKAAIATVDKANGAAT
jgi:preprotein translocase subunit YajC